MPGNPATGGRGRVLPLDEVLARISSSAACGTAVFTRARLQWLAGSQTDYPTLLTDAFTELGLLVAVRGD